MSPQLFEFDTEAHLWEHLLQIEDFKNAVDIAHRILGDAPIYTQVRAEMISTDQIEPHVVPSWGKAEHRYRKRTGMQKVQIIESTGGLL